MKITRGAAQTDKAPEDWFTGEVFIDQLKTNDASSRIQVANVHFAPGARTAWHSHPNGQTLIVTDGTGLIGRKDGKTEQIRPGDIVWIEPNEQHWHGATPNTFMSHIAIHETDEKGNAGFFGEKVTEEEYKNKI
jgi:quercetin dioxygenase-like cupin family protein